MRSLTWATLVVTPFNIAVTCFAGTVYPDCGCGVVAQQDILDGDDLAIGKTLCASVPFPFHPGALLLRGVRGHVRHGPFVRFSFCPPKSTDDVWELKPIKTNGAS